MDTRVANVPKSAKLQDREIRPTGIARPERYTTLSFGTRQTPSGFLECYLARNAREIRET
jgi:hypothetical protein